MTIHIGWKLVRDLTFLVWFVWLSWRVIDLNSFDETLSKFILFQMGMGQQESAPHIRL